MENIFIGLLKSSKPEREKTEVIKRIISVGESKKHTTEVIQMLQVASRVLLNGTKDAPESTTLAFQFEAAKKVYISWGSHHIAALQQYFTLEMLNFLLEKENFPYNCNAVWIMYESILLLKEVNNLYNKFCDVLQLKSTTYIRTHPAFNTMVPFCKLLRVFREGIPRSTMTPLFCNTIIDVVSLLTIPPDFTPYEYLSNMKSVIGDLLGHIWEKCTEETVWMSLTHIFELIKIGETGPDTKSPSIALAAVVNNVPVTLISRALESLLLDPTVQSTHLRTALDRMISWLQWPGAQNIHLWVTGFLQQLANAKKYSVLLDVTEASIEKLFNNCKIIQVRENSLAVLTVMLMGYRHSPIAFHKIADHIPALILSIKKEGSPESVSVLKELNLLIHCMMHLHPGFPEIYEPIIQCTRDIQPPSVQTIEERLSTRGWVGGRMAGSGGNGDARGSRNTFFQRSTSTPSTAIASTPKQTDKRGLTNEGNTCYMNSIIQALYMCDSFRQEVLSASVSASESVKFKLQRAFAFLSMSERPFINSFELLSLTPPWFEQGQQQDCAEFLRYLLDQMQDQETGAPKFNPSNGEASSASSKNIVQNAFCGKIQNTHKCLKCGNESVTYESFFDLQIPFAKNSKTTPKLHTRNGDIKKETVENMLLHYFDPEKMSGENKYSCEKCSKLQEAERTMKIAEAPNYLVLTLLRFAYDQRLNHRSKIFTDVFYPKQLSLPVLDEDSAMDVSPSPSTKNGFMSSKSSSKGPHSPGSTLSNHSSKSSSRSSTSPPSKLEHYALVGVVVHSGVSLDVGHYYTYARNSSPSSSSNGPQPQNSHVNSAYSTPTLSHHLGNPTSSAASTSFPSPDSDQWYLFNDHRVTRSSYSSFSAVQRTFTKDTPYVLVYKKVSGGGVAGSENGVVNLRSDLLQMVERDNARYVQEYEEERRREALNRPVYNTTPWWGNNDDNNPPPSGPGGGGLGGPRLVF